MRSIKKQRVDIMAVLKNHELRIMVVEQSLYHLVQALSSAGKEKTAVGVLPEQEQSTAVGDVLEEVLLESEEEHR